MHGSADRPKWHVVVLLVYLLYIQVAIGRLRHRSLRGECEQCGPGWGVVKACAPPAHTICQPCRTGSYSPHHSYLAPCWPCSRCGPGLYEAHSCTPARDTVCDSCQRLRDLNITTHCN